MSGEAIFVRDGERLLPAELARGPWDPGALHGGAPAALLVHELESCVAASELHLARLTCEFVAPVPLAPLSVTVETLRPGRRVTWLEAAVRNEAGDVVTRARGLFVAPSELGEASQEPPPFPGPEAGLGNDFPRERASPPMFATHGIEIRFVEGAFAEPGPATAWFRLRGELVAGEPVSGLARVAAAGDFGNGIASELSWEDHLFINPDLTLYMERPPVGEWVALQARTRVTPGAVSVAESVLWDERGRIGRASQALLVGRR